MPLTRCLGAPGQRCGKLIDSKLSRCFECDQATKAERRRQQREFGPCPQDGLCPYCHEPASTNGKGPFVWCHVGKRFAEGGTTVVPGHDYCNRGPARRGRKR